MGAEDSASMRPTRVVARGPCDYPRGMDWRTRITVQPEIRAGRPCVRGMRISVSDVLEYLASGMSESDIVRDFPELEPADVRACLLFAADRERTFSAAPPAA